MKEVFKKLLGIEPMSAEDREAFALLPAVLLFGALCLAMAVILG
jgi:hypothetical protein